MYVCIFICVGRRQLINRNLYWHVDHIFNVRENAKAIVLSLTADRDWHSGCVWPKRCFFGFIRSRNGWPLLHCGLSQVRRWRIGILSLRGHGYARGRECALMFVDALLIHCSKWITASPIVSGVLGAAPFFSHFFRPDPNCHGSPFCHQFKINFPSVYSVV